MDATPVAPLAEPGDVTVELQKLEKLLRVHRLNQQLKTLSRERDELREQLTREGAL